jgi:O-acetyl-ADP-ribose deacetylase (regulator of RNase III)
MNEVIRDELLPSGQCIRLVRGDLTEERVDAIVNAANSHLAHAGGVAAAIVRKGGAVIQQESDRLAPVPVGEAVVTAAGALPARYVIHAVGPRWGEGDEDEKLRRAGANSLARAEECGCASIALPAVSSGIFGFPKDRCAQILIQTALDFYAAHPESSLREIRFTLFDAPTTAAFEEAFDRRWGSGTTP